MSAHSGHAQAMFGSLNTNMRRVVECLEPLDSMIRAKVENDVASNYSVDQSQFEALWSNSRQALRNLHDSAFDQLKQQIVESGKASSLRQDHVIDAVDYGTYRGEAGQIVLRDVVWLLSGIKIPAVTVVHFSQNPMKAFLRYGFGNSETSSLLSADRLPKHHCAVFPLRDEDWAILQELTVAESSLKEAIVKRKQRPV